MNFLSGWKTVDTHPQKIKSELTLNENEDMC